MTTDAPGLREAAEQIKSLVESPNIVDNIQRWYAIAPHADKLSKHYLATHPSDGGEAISEAKCRELGFKDVGGMLVLECPSTDYVGAHFIKGVEYPRIYVNGRGVMLNVKKTMTNLRHLLAALGCR